MGTEITTALIAYGGAMCASLIAFGGVLIGYLLQVLQRSWARADQRREWKKEKWDEELNSFRQLEQLVMKANLGAELNEDYWVEFDDSITDLATKTNPFDDNELGGILSLYLKKISEFYNLAKAGKLDGKGVKELTLAIRNEGKKYLVRLNSIIEESYK